MIYSLILHLLRFLPRNLLSRGFGWLASRRWPGWFANTFKVQFARKVGIDISEAEFPIDHYQNLIELFTRRLKENARPITTEPGVLANPVDGRVGAFGRIKGDRLVQAKGLDYSIEALLGSKESAELFRDGAFATLYLSPKDYHRIHAPDTGFITKTLYEPGTLWPVNPPAVRQIPQLFAINERITTLIETTNGPIAVAMVGATNVGSIRLAYRDFVTNRGTPRHQKEEVSLQIQRGDHLGTFELGSTVILLVGSNRFDWENLREGEWFPLGITIGRHQKPKAQ